MAQPKQMLEHWLKILPENALIGIDHGGLSITALDQETGNEIGYCEIGGLPEEQEIKNA